MLLDLILIEYKEPNEFKKNKLFSLKEKLFTNRFVTSVSSVGIDFNNCPFFLSKKIILLFWFAAIKLFPLIFKFDLNGTLKFLAQTIFLLI